MQHRKASLNIWPKQLRLSENTTTKPFNEQARSISLILHNTKTTPYIVA